MLDFETYLMHVLDDVEDSLVKEAMNYSLMAGGKRIRPNLLFSAMNAYGVDAEISYPAAAAIEMIHTYSLIHDDLPAMDNDTLRRGKPTCHVTYGEATAILAGDALLTQAFIEITKSQTEEKQMIKMIRYLSEYSGANGMVLGQIKDLEGEVNPDIQIDGLADIHFFKTGKLITLPLLMAAILTGHEEHIATWKEIGRYIGLSFQIQDDVLDVTSSNEVLGKNIHSDASNDKNTYVSLQGIEVASTLALDMYEKAWQLLDRLEIKKEAMQIVFDTLTKRKH